jgi:nucleoside-diphosphate-sugar epimerase
VNVIVFGATGMVGAGALIECLEDPRVHSILVIGRHSVGVSHPKLRELIRSDFFDYSDARADLAGYDACFFCLGVSSVGLSEAAYTRLTYDLTLAAARAIVEVNPRLSFCYVTGAGNGQFRAGSNYVGQGQGQDRKRSPGASLQGGALIHVAAVGYPKPILYSRDINALGKAVWQ